MRLIKRMRAAVVAAAVALSLASGSTMSLAATPADQLVVGMQLSNLLTLDPAGTGGKERDQILNNVYDGLLFIDPLDRQHLIPVLAESWEVSEDQATITFKMRKGATFASGNPVTAQDVVWSMHRMFSQNLNGGQGWVVRGFNAENAAESFSAPDDETFVIKLPRPTDPKILLMMLGLTAVLDSKLVLENDSAGDLGATWLKSNSAGSGPYVLSQFRANDMVLIERDDNYWGEAPALRRILFRHIPESQAQRLQLERGDIDVAYTLAAPDLQAMAQRDDVVVETNGGGGFYYLAVSLKDERFANPKVREAIRYLIDYEGLNSAVLPYFGIPHQRPVHKGLLGELAGPDYTLDVERAKALLAEAGYPDGFDTTIRALSDAPFRNLATAIQATLAQGGIRAEVITGSGDQVYGAMRERNFEIVVGRSGGTVPHPDADLRGLAYNPDNSDAAQLTGVNAWRVSFFDQQINDMIDAAMLEVDPDKQRQLYEDIQRRYDELIPAIQPFSQVSDSVAYRSDIKGLVIHPSWTTDLAVVHKER